MCRRAPGSFGFEGRSVGHHPPNQGPPVSRRRLLSRSVIGAVRVSPVLSSLSGWGESEPWERRNAPYVSNKYEAQTSDAHPVRGADPAQRPRPRPYPNGRRAVAPTRPATPLLLGPCWTPAGAGRLCVVAPGPAPSGPPGLRPLLAPLVEPLSSLDPRPPPQHSPPPLSAGGRSRRAAGSFALAAGG